MTAGLPEDVMLLALDEARGTAPSSVGRRLDYALRGALLLELATRGRLRLEGRDAVVIDASPTGDDLLDEALAALAGRTRSVKHWVGSLQVPRLRRRVCERLVRSGALRREPRSFLGITFGARYPAADPAPRRELAEAIRSALLGSGPVDDATAARVALAHAAGEVPALVPRDRRRAAERRAKEIAAGDMVGEAVDRVVREVNAAVIAAVVAATAASSSAATTTTNT